MAFPLPTKLIFYVFEYLHDQPHVLLKCARLHPTFAEIARHAIHHTIKLRCHPDHLLDRIEAGRQRFPSLFQFFKQVSLESSPHWRLDSFTFDTADVVFLNFPRCTVLHLTRCQWISSVYTRLVPSSWAFLHVLVLKSVDIHTCTVDLATLTVQCKHLYSLVLEHVKWHDVSFIGRQPPIVTRRSSLRSLHVHPVHLDYISQIGRILRAAQLTLEDFHFAYATNQTISMSNLVFNLLSFNLSLSRHRHQTLLAFARSPSPYLFAQELVVRCPNFFSPPARSSQPCQVILCCRRVYAPLLPNTPAARGHPSIHLPVDLF